FLGNVQGLVRVPHIAHHQIDDLVLILENQQVESTLVTLLDAADQLGVGRFTRHTGTSYSRSGGAGRPPDRPRSRPAAGWKVSGCLRRASTTLRGKCEPVPAICRPLAGCAGE